MTDSSVAIARLQIAQLLARGESAVVDASFAKRCWRAAVSALVADTSTDLTELCCRPPADVAAARLMRRAASGGDASDATASVATAMALEFDRWPTAAAVGTLPPAEDVVPAVLERLRPPHPRLADSSRRPGLRSR